MTVLLLQGSTTFSLAADRREAALALLQTHYDAHMRVTLRDDAGLEPFATLEEALSAFGWKASEDPSGTITFVSFTDASFQSEHNALEVIACCVTVGSSLLVALKYEGRNDFDVEQWLFDGTWMHRLKASLSFTVI